MTVGPGERHANRVALVTGGAGAIGSAVCRSLAAGGAAVAVVDVDRERTSQVVAEVESLCGRAVGVVADLTVEGAIHATVGSVVDELGPVDVLVNGLGHHLYLSGPFEDSEEAGWDALYRINLLHVIRATQAVVPSMRERGWGRIVNFSSVEGVRAMPHAAPYAAFKGAVDSFTRSLGVELAPFGICVNAVAVDKVRAHQTGFYHHLSARAHAMPGWIPADRIGEPADVAEIVSFLASDGSGWMTGQTLAADGGTLAAGGWHRTPTGWTNTPDLVEYAPADDGR